VAREPVEYVIIKEKREEKRGKNSVFLYKFKENQNFITLTLYYLINIILTP
jgi:hypothetical protein